MKTLDKTQKGFTLIELMIVVAIIGILAMMAIPAYTYYIERAISIEPLQLVKVLHDAVRLYYTENEKLPEVGTESQAILNWDKNSHGYYVDKIVIEKVDTSVDIIVTYGVYMNQEAIHKAKQKAQIKLDEWAKTASLIYAPSFFISSAFAQSVQVRPHVIVY